MAPGPSAAIGALLAAGADPAPIDAHGLTPLHLAARGGHADCLELLLHSGAPADALSAAGVAPIALAVASGDPEAVEVLLGAGGAPADAEDAEVLRWMAGAMHGDEGGAALGALLR